MNKKLKIFLGVMVFLAMISGIFLIFSKKKTAANAVPHNAANSQQDSGQHAATKQLGENVNPTGKTTQPLKNLDQQKNITSLSSSSSQAEQDRMMIQWRACSQKAIKSNVTLYWSMNIVEAIPTNGTYARGSLNGRKGLPVKITIKSSASEAEKIRARILPGKDVILRGNCMGTTPEGLVTFEAY